MDFQHMIITRLGPIQAALTWPHGSDASQQYFTDVSTRVEGRMEKNNINVDDSRFSISGRRKGGEED